MRSAKRKALTTLAGLALAAGAAAAGGGPAAAYEIVPHRAIYGLDLASSRSGARISDVDGRMLFKWEETCDGWVIEQRYLMTFLYNEGDSMERTITYTTWESKSGLEFTFTYRGETDGRVTEEFRGSAELDSVGGPGEYTYRVPEERVAPLPDNTYFPTRHTLALLEHAEAGEPLFFSRLFDGSGESGLWEINAFVGADAARADNASAGSAGSGGGDGAGGDARVLLSGRSWPVQLAFFAMPEVASTPEYEMDMRLFESGAVGEMRIDYGDFAIDARLSRAERLEPPECQ
ncbi:MAG: DUF1849 family protein [Azospirillaceae bacterium]